MLGQYLVAKAQHLRFLTDVADVVGQQTLLCAGQTSGFVHVFLGDIAHRHMSTRGDKLADQFSSHAGAAAGDYGNFVIKVFHTALVSPSRYCYG